jgi:hypothetical protein
MHSGHRGSVFENVQFPGFRERSTESDSRAFVISLDKFLKGFFHFTLFFNAVWRIGMHFIMKLDRSVDGWDATLLRGGTGANARDVRSRGRASPLARVRADKQPKKCNCPKFRIGRKIKGEDS